VPCQSPSWSILASLFGIILTTLSIHQQLVDALVRVRGQQAIVSPRQAPRRGRYTTRTTQ
jgi:hypothetical protein